MFDEKNRIQDALLSIGAMILVLFLATLIGDLFVRKYFATTSVVLLYVLAIVLTSRFTKGYVYGVAASLLSIFIYNFFFTEPLYSLAVNDPSYLLTFAVMMITSLITSTLTSHAQANALEAKQKESEATALYQLTNHLTDANNLEEICQIAMTQISDMLLTEVQVNALDEDNDSKEKAKWSRDGHYQENGYDYWFIYGKEKVAGVIGIKSEVAKELTDSQVRLLRAMNDSIALAMDRVIEEKQRMHFQEETLKERYRSDMLRAISHDLRTPLSGIMGTSEMMMGMSEEKSEYYTMARHIYEDADWLYSLVENILNLTRLEEGKLALHKQSEVVDEVVAEAIMHIEKRAPGYVVNAHMSEDVLLVPMDAKLIVQVLVNLLDNAIKHSSHCRELDVYVSKKDKDVMFTVEDQGEGISKDDLPHIFQSFYTTNKGSLDSRKGIGLGLAICNAIVKAHGGNIWAENREVKGARFVFTLPMGE